MTYTVTRQAQWMGELMVEISDGGIDYVNPDMLSEKYDHEGETFDDPVEAVDAAIEILNQWRSDNPDEHIEIGYGATMGFTMPFGESDTTEIKEWAQKEYDQLPKCDQCGDIITELITLIDDPFEMKFCSERCAERAYEDSFCNDEPEE